jgi:cytochrome c peroxidase
VDLARAAEANPYLGLPNTPTSARVADAEPLARLGRKLFFDTRLSADGKVSCAKCHVPGQAFTDGRARSAGHNEQLGTRNAPTLLNVVYNRSLFWDGRRSSLESQALAPLTNPTEHALSSEREIERVIHIDSNLVARALAAYERTLRAGDSPFDRYLYGHDPRALSTAAVRGLELFLGRAQCASCHQINPSSAMLTDGDYHVSPLGLPAGVTAILAALTQKVVGLRDDPPSLEKLIATDAGVAALGRFVATLNPTDIGKFKTPSLRNVALTAPYMHDGSVATLERAIELELYGRQSALSYPIALTTSERQDLLEFLRSLTSRGLPGAVPTTSRAMEQSTLSSLRHGSHRDLRNQP